MNPNGDGGDAGDGTSGYRTHPQNRVNRGQIGDGGDGERVKSLLSDSVTRARTGMVSQNGKYPLLHHLRHQRLIPPGYPRSVVRYE